jgi:hypothetical protein
LTLASPFTSLSLISAALARGAAAINKAPLASATTPDAATKARIAENYGKLPLSFEANQGQFGKQARFVSRGGGYRLALAPASAALFLRTADSRAIVQMQPLNANPNPTITGVDKLPGVSNYFRGNNPKNWRTDVPHFAKVKYDQVYPGIDLVYYGNQRQLEYDFVVAPGVDPNKIKLGFTGADEIKIADNGDLLLNVKGRELRQHRPIIYQEVNGHRAPIAGRFVIEGKNRVRFDIGEYDCGKELVIDPTVSLSYSTFVGDEYDDKALAIAANSSGNTFVTGETASPSYDISGSVYDSSCGTNGSCNSTTDVFVTKLASDGKTLVWSTFIGGSSDETGRAIAVDSSGDIHIAGNTNSTDFPAIASPFQGDQTGDDGFLFKLSSGGNSRLYATYIGGSGSDQCHGIAMNGSYPVVVGESNSNNLSTSSAPYDSTSNGGYDAFVAEFDTSLTGASSRRYLTYLGGSTSDYGRAVAVQGGYAYVTGYAQSTNFPVKPNTGSPLAYDTSRGGLQDAFVAKINPANGGSSDLTYSTYFGGGGRDAGYGIAVNSSGEAFVTGETNSAHNAADPFPVLSAYQGTNGGSIDVFVVRFNSTGTGISYSTFLGGNGDDKGFAITLDSSSNAFIAGETASTNYPIASQFQVYQAGTDAFITKLGSSGATLSFSTYHAGVDTDSARGIAVVSGTVYFAGYTDSFGELDYPGVFPVEPKNWPSNVAYQISLAGGFDAFVAKISGL